jgi:hypothetical protein
MNTSAATADMRNDSLLAFAMIVLLLGVFIGFPMAAENTARPCLALERHVAGGIAGVDDGSSAARAASTRMPSVPSFLGCTVLYWQDMLDGGT